jgi:hypothetical protein
MAKILIKKSARFFTRRRVFRAAGAGLLLLVLLGWLGSIDDDMPDISDLKPTLRQLPDDQNAFLMLEKAVGLVKWENGLDIKSKKFVETYFGRTLSQQELEDFADIAKFQTVDKSWDAAKIGPWLAPLGDVWPLLAQAAGLPSGQVPLGYEIDQAVYDPTSGLSSKPVTLQDLFAVSTLRAWQFCDDGRTDDGIDWLLAILHATRSLQESRGGISIDELGRQFRASLESALVAMAARPGASPATVRRALVVLSQTRSAAEELVQNLRVDFQGIPSEIEALHQGGFSGRTRIELNDPYQWQLLFKPNQTLRLEAETLRDAFKQINADWIQIEAWADQGRSRFPTPYTEGWRGFNPNNFFGRMFAQSFVRYLTIFIRDRQSELSRDSATEAVLGLFLYHRDHGALPAKLDQLVPDYLPAVPIDRFDGYPIRYSRDFLAVWSIGYDHFTVTSDGPASDDIVDNKIDESESISHQPVYYRLDFAVPPKSAPPAESALPNP